MCFPDRLRLPLAFDPARLARDLESLSAVAWTRHAVRQNYDGDWSIIPLRSVAGETHPVRMSYPDPMATAFEDTAVLRACPYFQEVLAAFACEVHCVRLMRLAPGSVIKEHTDHLLQAENGRARLHIPILTNPGTWFEINRARVDLAPGGVWYLRLSDPHRAANHGDTDRVHMVIDLVVNPWLEDLLERASNNSHPLIPAFAGRSGRVR